MNVVFRNMTQLQRERLMPVVQKVANRCPWWVRNLRIVNYSELGTDNASMSCTTEQPYQSMYIYIAPGIFDSWTDEELFNDMMHEVAHGFNDGVRHVVDNVLDKFIKDEDQLEIVKALFVRAIEFDTETLAVLFRDPGTVVAKREMIVEDN